MKGFNEAGASPPRKSQRSFYYTEEGIHASMRPGRLHPGNLPDRGRTVPAKTGFNEAGASPPRK